MWRAAVRAPRFGFARRIADITVGPKFVFNNNFNISLEYKPNPSPPTREPKSAQQGPQQPGQSKLKSYDFEIDIRSVAGVGVQGWPVKVLEKSAGFLLTSLPSESAKEQKPGGELEQANVCPIVGVLGYYSKGKSFIVNGLYNAGLNLEVPAQNKAYLSSPPPAKSVHEDYRLVTPMGPGVTTKGISGVFTCYKLGADQPTDKIKNARLLILDTAGRNAPATESEGPRRQSVGRLSNLISAMRSKERLLDDIMVDISHAIIYVVDELLNEDQRTIAHTIEAFMNRTEHQRLIVIHNWKRLKIADKETIETHIDEQLKRPFGAEEVDRAPNSPEARARLWESKWYPDDPASEKSAAEVTHAILLDDTDPASKAHNKLVFLGILQSIRESAPSRRVGNKAKRPVLQVIYDSAQSAIGHYVNLLDGEEKVPPKAEPGMGFEWQEPSKPDADADGWIKWKGQEKKRLVHFEWTLREMPAPRHQGDFLPWNSEFNLNEPSEGPSAERRRHYIYVELPGIGAENVLGSDEPPAPDRSWVRVSEASSADSKHKVFTVTGVRHAPAPLPLGAKPPNVGKFELNYNIPAGFTFESLKVNNGFMRIECLEVKQQKTHKPT